MSAPLRDPLLHAVGIRHGFGIRASVAPTDTVFPRQVHGVAVLDAGPGLRGPQDREADAIVTGVGGTSLGIVTADCVPILVAAVDGQAVGAIHAGWRGLAAGVIEAGLAALRERAPSADLICAVGPAARGCCYEVDEPVRSGLAERYAEHLPEVLLPGTPGHYQLDLPLLASRVLEGAGVDSTRIGTAHRVCTICDADRFESYRRDGAAAGRLRHFITHSATIPRQG